MPNRVQTLRSSVSGNVPAAGTRQPGELWVNFADFALGFIDSAQAAQKLLAVRLFVTTANYAVGDFVVQGGNLYRAIAASSPGGFSAANWSKVGTAQDLAAYLPIAGGTLTGALTLAANPTAALGAATKQYVDTGDTAALAATALMLPLAGGTLTGPIVLAANPTAPLQPATKQYVDNLPSGATGPNRVDNGDMWIDQHNGGAVVVIPANGAAWTMDRFLAFNQQATSRFNVGQNYPAAITAGPPGFPWWLGVQSTSAYTSAAGAYFMIQHGIEAAFIADLMQGTVNAQTVTVSFWARSSLTGNFSFALQSGLPTTTGGTVFRMYATTFSLPTANTWTKIVITIPGDTTTPAAWPQGGSSPGLYLVWDIGSGATYQTSTLNAWQTTAAFAAAGAVHVTGTNNANMAITGVKLEAGSVATPYPVEDLARKFARCQRYFLAGDRFDMQSGAYVAGVTCFAKANFPVTMRAAPTITAVGAGSNTNVSALTLGAPNPQGAYAAATALAVGNWTIIQTYTASAEI